MTNLRRLFLFATILLFAKPLLSQNQSVKDQLQLLGFDSIHPIELNVDRFSEGFVMYVQQPVDHRDASKGSFAQRVFVRHRGFDRPTVMVTEGYAAGYARWKGYDEEIARALDANLVVVEHRYFGKSVPNPINWEELNLTNATADLHHVNQLLKQLYPQAWVSTGISKGGQTTIYYRYFYPDDVQASVPYVAPLNFSVADKRVYHFKDTVATAACRNRLQDLQTDLLRRRAVFEPMFVDSAAKRGLTFTMVGGIEKAYEYNVLEFGFAYWQWYPIGCDGLPEAGRDTNEVFNAFIEAAGYDFFADQSILGFQPFFYQALTEMGFYSYDTKPFKDYLKYVEKPNFNHTLPTGVTAKYSKRLSKKVNRWLQKNSNNMLYVYGGYDAWSSTAVQPGNKTNALKLVLPGGSHATRLGNFDDVTYQHAIKQLKEWVGQTE